MVQKVTVLKLYVIEVPGMTDEIEGFSKEIWVQSSSLGNYEDLTAGCVFGTEGDGGRNAFIVVESHHGSRFWQPTITPSVM